MLPIAGDGHHDKLVAEPLLLGVGQVWEHLRKLQIMVCHRRLLTS
jgi:hypothetical protein